MLVGPPKFTIIPKDLTVIKGKNAYLPCAATAVPIPQIHWKLNAKYLNNTRIIQNGTLVISIVGDSQLYEGNYTCEASNSVGTKSSTALLTVHSKSSAKLQAYHNINWTILQLGMK